MSMNGRASAVEGAHIITGYATIYLIIGMLLIPAKDKGIRLPASVALVAALLEGIPGMPRGSSADTIRTYWCSISTCPVNRGWS